MGRTDSPFACLYALMRPHRGDETYEQALRTVARVRKGLLVVLPDVPCCHPCELQLHISSSNNSSNPQAHTQHLPSSLFAFRMSWRNNLGSTGANNIPLGSRRRFEDGDSATPEAMPQPTSDLKRGRSPTRGTSIIHPSCDAILTSPRSRC